jgi:hypothetical protein
MDRKSDNMSLAVLGGILALFLLLHTIFNILFEEWIKHQLEHHVGYTVAEMIERFGAIALPVLAAICVVWLLFHYLKREFNRELQTLLLQQAARFELVYDADDERFVKKEENKTLYRVGLHVLGNQTIDLPNILVFDSPFTERIIAPIHSRAGSPVGSIRIYQGGALDPDVLELIDLCELPNERKFLNVKNESGPLGHAHTFIVEARARHCKPVPATFRYDPGQFPMVTMVT